MTIKIAGLSKIFNNNKVLDDISLEISQGEIFGLVGPDGAGKTTLIRTILDLYKPDTGKIVFLGEENIEKIKNLIGYVPQQFSLNLDMTVWENISLFASLQSIPQEKFNETIEPLLKMVWLNEFKDRLAGNLSGGMKQKLALISAIVHNPKVLFLDEPTTGVDPVSRRDFWQLLYRLNQKGLTILVSTPYMDEVELCDKIAFINNGQIVATGSPYELLKKYPYTILSITMNNPRSFIDSLSSIKAQNIYLKGNELRIAIHESDKAIAELKNTLTKIGFTNIDILKTEPTLEDLFSLLSNEMEH